ncbi:MAG: hypothetical protein IPM00_16315 [Tetrasphaera sp.]|nr:hypothetical protein [Tetrasphaera sp.]
MEQKRRESGQAVTAVSVVAMLFVLGAGLWLILPFSKGTSELSKLKSGTDAAALAGAQAIVADMWPTVQASLNAHGVKTFKGGSGQIRAQEFAGKNSATVTSYHYFPLADRVEVEAMTTYITATGKAERAKSVAETGRHLDECVPDAPLVTTTTGYNATAHCGEIQVDIYVPPSTTPLQLLTPPGQLKKMFTVRLAE